MIQGVKDLKAEFQTGPLLHPIDTSLFGDRAIEARVTVVPEQVQAGIPECIIWPREALRFVFRTADSIAPPKV